MAQDTAPAPQNSKAVLSESCELTYVGVCVHIFHNSEVPLSEDMIPLNDPDYVSGMQKCGRWSIMPCSFG